MRPFAAILWMVLLPAALSGGPATVPLDTPLVFTHVTVIAATRAPPQANMTVVVRGEHIVALGPNGKVQIPKRARVVDATGKYLIPGLWDMHVHLSEAARSFPLFIANGIVGVRDMGSDLAQVQRWRELVQRHKLLGPEIITPGPVLDGPFPAHPEYALTVRNETEARQAVDSLKQNGADFIKTYDGLSRDAYFALADEARKQGLPFEGHVPAPIRALEATNAGQKSIEHLSHVIAGCSTNEDEILEMRAESQRRAVDLSSMASRVAFLGNLALDTYNEGKAAELFAAFVRNSTWQVPTLVTRRVLGMADEFSDAEDHRSKYIPESIRDRWNPDDNPVLASRTPDYIRYRKKAFAQELEIVGAMHRAGVKILAGTDAEGAFLYPGFSLHEELALLVEAGLTPMEALETATRNPAEFLGRLASEGTIETGKIADLVLLEANPLTNIHNTQKIRAVVLRGRFLSKAALDKLLSEAEAAAQ